MNPLHRRLFLSDRKTVAKYSVVDLLMFAPFVIVSFATAQPWIWIVGMVFCTIVTYALYLRSLKSRYGARQLGLQAAEILRGAYTFGLFSSRHYAAIIVGFAVGAWFSVMFADLSGQSMLKTVAIALIAGLIGALILLPLAISESSQRKKRS